MIGLLELRLVDHQRMNDPNDKCEQARTKADVKNSGSSAVQMFELMGLDEALVSGTNHNPRRQ